MATEFSNGKQTVKLYRSVNRGKEMYQLAFYQAGRRVQKNFSDKAEAKRVAKQILGELTNDAVAVEAMATPELESLIAARRILVGGYALHVAVEEHAQIVEGRATGKEVVAVSSVHRISDTLADRIHDLHVEKTGRHGQTPLDVHVKRDLQPAELRSSQFYRVGDVVEFKQADAVARAPVTSVLANAVVVERNGEPRQVRLNQVRAVFDPSRIERGPGEKLLLQEKIKQDDRIFEKGSRQTIAQVNGGTVYFESGLRLHANDGRVRQGDCLTDYKAQGIKGAEVRGSHQMIMPRHAPPGAYVDDPAEKLDRPASEQPSVFTLASHGMTRIKEWAARGKAKQRALRHDLVTLSLCPEMLPCKHPSAAWCTREHGVSRQWASRLQQEFAREFGDHIQFRGQRFLNRANA